LKRFRLSYIGWWYRQIIFNITFADLVESTIKRLKSPSTEKIETSDFFKLKSYWEDEYLRVIDAAKQKRRSYKLWEYLIKF